MNLGTSQVIRADARSLPLADNTVDLVVTSPPYFALRSYQDGGEHYAGQIGSEPTPAEFVAALLEVTRECVRVLKPSGSLWVNLGDKYAGPVNPRHGNGVSLTNAEHHQKITTGYRRVNQAVRGKSLIGIPWRYALACIDDLGLILRAEVIWSKPNGLPESVTDRVRRSHEQWFHFTLEPRYFSAVDEIREEHTSPVAIGRRLTGGAPENGGGQRFGADGSRHTDGHPLGKLPGSVWTDDAPGESLVRSVLAATAAGALTPEEGERVLWTGSTGYGPRSKRATSWTAGAGSAPTTDTATGVTGRPAKEIDEHTDSSMKSRPEPYPQGSPSTTSAATAGASTPHTSSQSPYKSTYPDDYDPTDAPPDMPTTSRTHTSDAMANESAGPAWLLEQESDGGAHPSVWQIATEPLRVPDHLGIDHFAAFPTEWPKRIIRGWSPAGVCVECGEGRRPVVDRESEARCPSGAQFIGKRTRSEGNIVGANRAADVTTTRTISGYACACLEPTAPTTPAVILDPFGGTGTTALVAKALGRHGISVDMSADYCRLAEWRTNDRDQLAKVLGIEKVGPVDDDQLDLFGETA